MGYSGHPLGQRLLLHWQRAGLGNLLLERQALLRQWGVVLDLELLDLQLLDLELMDLELLDLELLDLELLDLEVLDLELLDFELLNFELLIEIRLPRLEGRVVLD